MLSKKGLDNILKRIMSSGELTDEMENDINSIKADFDEKENYLKKYGTVYDGEENENYDYTENQISTTGNETDYKSKFEDMRQKYIDRFFGAITEGETVNTIMKETKEDVKQDGEEQTFEDLFEKREG